MPLNSHMPIFFLLSGLLIIFLAFYVAMKNNNTILSSLGLVVGLVVSLFGAASFLGLEYDPTTGKFKLDVKKIQETVDRVDSEQKSNVEKIQKTQYDQSIQQGKIDESQKKIDDQFKQILLTNRTSELAQEVTAKLTQENVKQDNQLKLLKIAIDELKKATAPSITLQTTPQVPIVSDFRVKFNVAADKEADARSVRNYLIARGAGVNLRVTDFREISNRSESGVINIVYIPGAKLAADEAKSAVEKSGLGNRIKIFQRVESLAYGDVQVNFW
jgi:hypothetical protein